MADGTLWTAARPMTEIARVDVVTRVATSQVIRMGGIAYGVWRDSVQTSIAFRNVQ